MGKVTITEDKLNQLIYEATLAVLNESEMDEWGWKKGAGLVNNIAQNVGYGVERLKQRANDARTMFNVGRDEAQADYGNRNVRSDYFDDNEAFSRNLNAAGQRKNPSQRYDTVSRQNTERLGNTTQSQQGNTNSQTPQDKVANSQTSDIRLSTSAPNVTASQNNAPSAQQSQSNSNTHTATPKTKVKVNPNAYNNPNTRAKRNSISALKDYYQNGRGRRDIGGYDADIIVKALDEFMRRHKVNESQGNVNEENVQELFNLFGRDKKERALKYYDTFLKLKTQANQAYAKVKNKSAQAFGVDKKDAYGASLNYAKNGYQPSAPNTAPVSENVDEDFIGGVKSGAKNVVNNIKNKPISQTFSGTRTAYRQGDASGDAENYQALVAKANQAWKTFTDYCSQNNIDKNEIKQLWQNNNRNNVITGKDNSRLADMRAKRQGKFGGTGGAASGLASLNKAPKSARDANNDFKNQGGGLWEEKKES